MIIMKHEINGWPEGMQQAAAEGELYRMKKKLELAAGELHQTPVLLSVLDQAIEGPPSGAHVKQMACVVQQ